ncbi:MAG: YncE family protein, partial [Sciscionella sp.]
SPHDATAAGGHTFFAANEAGRSVTVVRDGKVVHQFTDVAQPAGLAAVGDQVALVDVRQDNLHVYNSTTLRVQTTLPAGNGPTHVVADKHGTLAVTDTRGNALLLYTLGTHPKQVGKLNLPGKPYGMTYDPVRDRVWVTLTALNQLVGIDISGSTPRVVRRIPTVRAPYTDAVDSASGRLFVTGTRNGKLQIIDQ